MRKEDDSLHEEKDGAQMKRRDTIVRYTAPERINTGSISNYCFVLAAVRRAGLLFPILQLVDAYHGAPTTGANSAPVCRRGYLFASFAIMFFSVIGTTI